MTHRELRDLILRGDWDDSESEIARAHLAECSDCARGLERLERWERPAAWSTDIPFDREDPAAGLSDLERQAARESQIRVLRDIAATSPHRIWSLAPRALVPLAAAAALLLFLIPFGGSGPRVTGFRAEARKRASGSPFPWGGCARARPRSKPPSRSTGPLEATP